jgi:hypothetical protein
MEINMRKTPNSAIKSKETIEMLIVVQKAEGNDVLFTYLPDVKLVFK